VPGSVIASVIVTGAVCATISSAQADKATKPGKAPQQARPQQARQLKATPIKIAQAELPMIESLRVTRGGQITLPLNNVTKILPDDEEIARGRFIGGRAVIEGVTTG